VKRLFFSSAEQSCLTLYLIDMHITASLSFPLKDDAAKNTIFYNKFLFPVADSSTLCPSLHFLHYIYDRCAYNCSLLLTVIWSIQSICVSSFYFLFTLHTYFCIVSNFNFISVHKRAPCRQTFKVIVCIFVHLLYFSHYRFSIYISFYSLKNHRKNIYIIYNCQI